MFYDKRMVLLKKKDNKQYVIDVITLWLHSDDCSFKKWISVVYIIDIHK